MRPRSAETLALVSAVALPFVLTLFYVENIFYEYGAVYNDAGLFAQVLYRNDLSLTMRAAYSDYPLPYFYTHLALGLLPVSLVSWLLPTGPVQFMACFHAAVIAVVAAAAYRALSAAFGSRVFAVFGAWATAFCGLCVHSSWNPHFEIVIPALVVATSVALFQKQDRLAFGLLLGLFATREDAPFQFAVFWGAVTVLGPHRSPAERAAAYRFLRLAIGLGIIAFALQQGFFPPRPVFSIVYSGPVPWAHLTSAAVGERLEFLFTHRVDLWAPLALILVFGLVRRERLLLAAILAITPWFLLHLTAVFEGAARFTIHYGFPFLTTLLAPALALVRDPEPEGSSRARKLLALQVAVLLLASVRADARPPFYALSPMLGRYGHPPDAEVVRETERLMDYLQAQSRAGAVVCASDSAASLRLNLVVHHERIRSVFEPRAGCGFLVSFRRDHERAAVERARLVRESGARCNVEHTFLVVDVPPGTDLPFACDP